MKILKDETYQNLLKQIADNAALADTYLKQKNELTSKLLGLKNKFHYCRAVLGAKGSGKTTFLKQMIKDIPHHFVICTIDEFPEVADENKFVITPNTKTVDEIINIMIAHKDRYIFIDDFWSPIKIVDTLYMHRRSMHRQNLKLNYTITTRSTSRLNEFVDKVDFIHNLK